MEGRIAGKAYCHRRSQKEPSIGEKEKRAFQREEGHVMEVWHHRDLLMFAGEVGSVGETNLASKRDCTNKTEKLGKSAGVWGGE